MAVMQEQVLAQARENSTNAVSVYSPSAGETAIIKSVVLCNQTTGALTYRLFLDNDGTTYDESTALAYDVDIAANSTTVLDVYWPMNDSNGNFAYRSSSANGITITLFGVVIS